MVDDLEVDVFLEHFGVKGMQWGTRKAYQPSAKREVKAKKLDKKAAEKQKAINYLNRQTPKTDRGKRVISRRTNALAFDKERFEARANDLRTRRITANQKAGVAAAVLLGSALASTAMRYHGTRRVNLLYPNSIDVTSRESATVIRILGELGRRAA